MKKYSDYVIQYSIDEAWAVFEGFEKLYGQNQVVNMAGGFSKPNKVHTLFPEEIETKMWQLPVSGLYPIWAAVWINRDEAVVTAVSSCGTNCRDRCRRRKGQKPVTDAVLNREGNGHVREILCG